MRLRKIYGLVPMGLLMGGCVLSTSETETDLAEIEQNLYPDTTKLWPQDKQIQVCWENLSTDASEPAKRGWVKAAVKGSWERYANLYFTGWGACSLTSKGIKIRIEDARPHTKGLGVTLKAVSAGMVLNFTFKNWSTECQSALESCIRSMAVHEFGHALGFAHEQNRADRPKWCVDEETTDSSGNYYFGEWDTSSVMNYCNPVWNNGGKLSETDIAGVRDMYGPKRLETFGYYDWAGGWRVDKHPRAVADVNGDHRDDIVGFGGSAVWVALSTGDGKFTPASEYLRDFSYDGQGFRTDRHPRLLGDVNADGRADIVAINNDAVWVSLSGGTTYYPPEQAVAGFAYNQGWRVDRHPRMLADVNGDKRPDIVGFGDAGVYVSLSLGGAKFGAQQYWLAELGYNANWRVEKHPRMMADVNGDGRADAVAFGDDGVYVALSSGSGFQSARRFMDGFGYNAGGWRVEKHPRMMADINRDGRADIVGFGDDGVYFSLSSGSEFNAPSFTSGLGYNQGWRVDRHTRLLADVTGDGRPDVVGFGENDVYVMAAQNANFKAKAVWLRRVYGTDDRIGSITPQEFQRTVGDLNGDGAADLIGFNADGVQTDLTQPL